VGEVQGSIVAGQNQRVVHHRERGSVLPDVRAETLADRGKPDALSQSTGGQETSLLSLGLLERQLMLLPRPFVDSCQHVKWRARFFRQMRRRKNARISVSMGTFEETSPVSK
jgi:hypothetical protein